MLDLSRIDKLIHEPVRLSIVTLLALRPGWPFQELKAQLKLSDGNLISHLRALHEAGYVAYRREILVRPQTRYELTERGEKAYRDYLAMLEQIVEAAKK